MTCVKPWFVSAPNGVNLRTNILSADVSGAPVFTFDIQYPFLPLGWLSDNTPLGVTPWPLTPNAAAQFYPNLQLTAMDMIFATENPPVAHDGIVYSPGRYSGYGSQFFNDQLSAINEPALRSNMDAIADFWLAELSLSNSAALSPLYGVPPNTWPVTTYPLGSTKRLYELISSLIGFNDNRLWVPPGIYTCDGTNVNTDLNNIFNNVNIGGGNILSFLAIELLV